jgi:hypothetical protein
MVFASSTFNKVFFQRFPFCSRFKSNQQLVYARSEAEVSAMKNFSDGNADVAIILTVI